MGVIFGLVDAQSAMGANLLADGTGFRTWAPHASAVAVVAGDALAVAQAAGWMPAPTDQLEPLGDGSWGGMLGNVGDGTPYMFVVEGPAGNGFKRDPYARELGAAPAYANEPCLVRDPTSYPWHDGGWQAPAFSDLVIYQLHVGTWWAADQTGADVRATRGGTFLDVATKIGHLAALGINAIQLLPIQEFETDTSLGYNGTDMFSPATQYCATPDELDWRLDQVNAAFATLGQPGIDATVIGAGINQLKCLIDLCHLNGIAVIFDQVYNHAFGHDDRGSFDDRSIWFYDRQVGGNDNNSLYFTDQIWVGPIFAYWNDWVSQFLIDSAAFCLEELHVDGIRYDEVSAISNHGGDVFAQRLTATIRATNPAAIQIAEYWNGDRARAVQPTPGGLGFDAELADGLRDSVRGLLTQTTLGLSAPLDLSAVGHALAATVGDAWRLNQCLENQDITYAGHVGAARVAALANPSARDWYARSRSRAATCLLLTAPGIPTLFMGEEFLENKNWSDSRGGNNLVWWEGLDVVDPTMRDFQHFVGDLIGVRRSEPALRTGSLRVSRVANFDRVLVFHRWLEGVGGDVIVVVSFDELPKHGYAIGLPFAGLWRERLNSDVYEVFPNPAPVGNGGMVTAAGGPLDGFACSATLNLPANGALILVRG